MRVVGPLCAAHRPSCCCRWAPLPVVCRPSGGARPRPPATAQAAAAQGPRQPREVVVVGGGEPCAPHAAGQHQHSASPARMGWGTVLGRGISLRHYTAASSSCSSCGWGVGLLGPDAVWRAWLRAAAGFALAVPSCFCAGCMQQWWFSAMEVLLYRCFSGMRVWYCEVCERRR